MNNKSQRSSTAEIIWVPFRADTHTFYFIFSRIVSFLMAMTRTECVHILYHSEIFWLSFMPFDFPVPKHVKIVWLSSIIFLAYLMNVIP